MVHPARRDLNLFTEEMLADAEQTKIIEGHLRECEFCREYCDNYRLYLDSATEAAADGIPERFLLLAEKIYRDALAGSVVRLISMTVDHPEREYHLAADSKSIPSSHVLNLATLYSEEPELVLRVMRDFGKGIDYMQLMGTDPQLISHVLIQLPDLEREFITDDLGRVMLPKREELEYEKLNWQVRLPNASFVLKPLSYDPDRTEESKSITLRSDHGDLIEVLLESKTEGKQIVVRVLKLDGEANYGEVKVSVSQQDLTEIKPAAPQKAASFGLIDPQKEISIRLFK